MKDGRTIKERRNDGRKEGRKGGKEGRREGRSRKTIKEWRIKKDD